MSKIKVELNHGQIGRFLHSQEVAGLVKSYADKAADRLGEGYKSRYKHMGTRVVASVFTTTDEAKRENMDNNSILKAVLEK
jgi:hypothetical protein